MNADACWLSGSKELTLAFPGTPLSTDSPTHTSPGQKQSSEAKQHIWLLPPVRARLTRVREILESHHMHVHTLDVDVPPSTAAPLVLIVDLVDAPGQAIETLSRLLQHVNGVPVICALVGEASTPYLSHILTQGICALWREEDPPEQVLTCIEQALAAYRSWQHQFRAQAMRPLYRIAQAFSDLTDLNALLQQILETSLRETDADRGSLMLVDEESNTLYIGVAVGLPEQVIRMHRQPIGEGIAGWVAQHRRPLILTEGEIPSFALPWLRGRNAYSSISVPLVHRNNLYGVLNLTKAPGKPPFGDGDQELLTILAAQAATAIHNARLFQEIQAAYEQLRQLDNLRTKLIDIAAHEMRTPVAVLKGYVELLNEQEHPELIPYLEPITRNVHRLEILVRDLFELSTLRSLERTPHPRDVDVRAWLADFLRSHEELVQTPGHRCALHIAPDATHAIFDPEHVYTILHHLLSNAAKFTPPGGELAIHAEREGNTILFHVDDSGPGIPETERERVFDGFYQVAAVNKREHEGLGLGLTIARALAQAHNGQLHISNSPLGGTRVTLSLPQPGRTPSDA